MRKIAISLSILLVASVLVYKTVKGQSSAPIAFEVDAYAQYTTNSLLRPSAVYISPTNPNYLFIADSGHNQIDVFNTGSLQVVAGDGNAGYQDGALNSARFNIPTGLGGRGFVQRCVGVPCNPTVNLDLIVVDTGNNAIRRICKIYSVGPPVQPTCSATGVTTASGGQSGYQDGTGSQAHFSYPGPSGSSFTLQGQLISDLGNNALRSVDVTGATVQTAIPSNIPGYQNGPLGNALFRGITSMTATADSSLLTDSGNYVIRKLDQSNNVSTFAGNGIQGYVDGPANTAEFSLPLSINYNPADGNTYVADALNNSIRRIDPAGNVSTYAGQATGGLQDGTGTQAMFSHPTSIAISNGFMYVADENNNAIRRIDMSNNVVSTLIH